MTVSNEDLQFALKKAQRDIKRLQLEKDGIQDATDSSTRDSLNKANKSMDESLKKAQKSLDDVELELQAERNKVKAAEAKKKKLNDQLDHRERENATSEQHLLSTTLCYISFRHEKQTRKRASCGIVVRH